MKNSPLQHFPFYATRDPEVARKILTGYGVDGYDVIGDASAYDLRVNLVSLKSMSIYYRACSAGVRMSFSAVDFVRQLNCISGSGRRVSPGGVVSNLDPRRWSAVVPAGESGSFEFGAGYEELRMVVDDDVMRRKLGALMGSASIDRIVFTGRDDVHSPGLARYRRLLAFLLSELDAGGPQSPGIVVNEIAEALLVSYLCGQEHNYSRRLAVPEQTPSSAQQRLAEDYIAAHWNEPLSVEDIAAATNVSVRSIFRSFKQTHGCSPFQYVKRVRLERARDMLREDGSKSVIGIALKCGFQSLGHFANSYRSAFGELPSQTVRR